MSISSQLAASRLIQPGVVANSAARPASPFTGQCVYQVDTNQLLVWNGTAWVIPNQTTQNPEGLELITPTGATNGTVSNGSVTIGSTVSSVTINGVFSSTYSSYRVVMSNITMSSTAAGTGVYVRMHDGTNPASSNYNLGIARIDIAAGTVSAVTVSLGVNGVLAGYGTGDKFGSSFDVINPNLATHTLFPSMTGVNVSTGYMSVGAAMHQTSSAYTGIIVNPTTGTFTGGTIAVYGYRGS